MRALSSNQQEAFDVLRSGTLSDRIAAADTLRFAIAEFPLNPVVEIWAAGKDLIEPSKPAAARTAGWELLTQCARHESSTDLERREYFQTLSAKANSDDFHLQLAALVDLTSRGRYLTGFDYELLPLLTEWLQQTYSAARAARKSGSASRPTNAQRGTTVLSGEEKNFAQLFAFVTDVVKFSFNSATDSSLNTLLETLLHICMNTNVQDDLRSCIGVIDAIVTFGTLPSAKLKDCIQVLSSIFCLVSTLHKESWQTLANICRSHNGQATVRILLDILRNLPSDGAKDKDVNREVRGSLAVLHKLMSKSAEKGYPTVPYALFMGGISHAVKYTSSSRVLILALQVVNTLFDDGNGRIHYLISEEDWTAAFEVAEICAHRVTPNAMRSKPPSGKEDSSEIALSNEIQRLITRLDKLVKEKTGDFIPRDSVINFLTSVHPLLPDRTAMTVLEYFQEFRSCSPSDLNWEENLNFVLEAFFTNRTRSSNVRLNAFTTMMDAYEVVDLVGDGSEQTFIPRLARRILRDVAEETDVFVLNSIMKLMCSVVTSCDMNLFNYIIDTLKWIVVSDRLKAPISVPIIGSSKPEAQTSSPAAIPEKSPSSVVTAGYVKMFSLVMNNHSQKSIKLYYAILSIAKSTHCEVDARLTAMKLLVRLRADWANRIFIATELESTSLAATMYRTEASLAKKVADDATHTLRTSRSDQGALHRASRGISFSQGQNVDRNFPIRTSSQARNVTMYEQKWKLPDPEALPDTIPKAASPVLVSSAANIQDDAEDEEDEEEDDDDDSSDEDGTQAVAIKISAWFDVVLSILHGSDWEVYSFVLVHLPSQLSNHALFSDTIPQMQTLRKIICDQIRTNSFQEPPNSSGLRRADVAICLYHSLTMILSYHEHFQKGEEDEIVRTFVHGISTWERCAKCCIHALSICCHELPISTSKLLVQMLNQMAAIITQPHVSVHILEFLACLSRLHHIYVNFREEEYRIVFAICFRYLEYAKEKKSVFLTSGASEPSTPVVSSPSIESATVNEDVPQYVHAIAYHVILFWFLAMKLQDRANHVGYIVKRLFADADGSDQGADEQAITSIDFLQRITYADVDESAEDTYFTKDRFGEIVSKQWLIGNSIVTIKQATTSGWAQIIRRQPSGSSSYVVRENHQPPPAHQVENNVDITREGQNSTNMILPSHLLLQLMSPIPQSFNSNRPIPLPDDEATIRTLKIFDRYSSVDGHKVGVIYIGEGQTNEREILSNVSGSSDYVEFLNNLGTITRLKGATFNTQGLDREYDTDGQYTFCWRDRVTEIVFHVTTQMPNMPGDEHYASKKRHIGNDFVNIIFNDSGAPFHFDTFPSQFNFVNIVITPASRASFLAAREEESADGEAKQQPFFRVQVLSKPGFPEISPASETKMVSLNALPGFVRLLALNASMFSLVWHNRDGGEHISSWTGRLREIRRLRDRHGPKVSNANFASAMTTGQAKDSVANSSTPPPLQQHHLDTNSAAATRPTSGPVRDSFTSLRRTSVATFFTNSAEQQPASHRSSMLSGSAGSHDTETAGVGGGVQSGPTLVDSVDFSKWA